MIMLKKLKKSIEYIFLLEYNDNVKSLIVVNCIFSSTGFSGGEIMEAIGWESLGRNQLLELIKEGAFSQDYLYWIVLKYKQDFEVCRAILSQATWVTLLKELGKCTDPEISAVAMKRAEVANHPAY